MERNNIIDECKKIMETINKNKDSFYESISLENEDFKEELIKRLNEVFLEHKDDLYYVKIREFINNYSDSSYNYNFSEWLKEKMLNKTRNNLSWLNELTNDIIVEKANQYVCDAEIISKKCEHLDYNSEEDDNEIQDLIQDTILLGDAFEELVYNPVSYMEKNEKNEVINSIKMFILKCGLKKITTTGVVRYITYRIIASKLPNSIKKECINEINCYMDELYLNKGKER